MRMVHKQERNYLLILPCSKQKKKLNNTFAMDVYDGPFYRVVRINNSKNLSILILSARYGLISSNELISDYDQVMTDRRAEELSAGVLAELEKALRKTYYDEIFINLGRTYMLAFLESKYLLDEYNVSYASGQIGERLHQLKIWLQAISNNK